MSRSFLRHPVLALLLTALSTLTTLPAAAEEQRLTVAAADSTCAAVQASGTLFAHKHGVEVEYLCKSSGRLVKGLKGEAIRADYFISANREWMAEAVAAGLVEERLVQHLWSNRLVVAAPRDHPLELTDLEGLAAPGVERILIGDPSTAPFGRYAKQALTTSGVWERVRPRITTRKNISLVARELAESPAGTVAILFQTGIDDTLTPLFTIPTALHDDIAYQSAPLRHAPNPGLANALARFLASEPALAVFRRFGFATPP